MIRICNPRIRCQFGIRRCLGWTAATGVFVAALSMSVPLATSAPDSGAEPANPEEVALAQEITDWLLGGEAMSRFTTFTAADLAAALRREPQTFQLFHRPHLLEAESRLLASLPYGVLIEQAARRHGVDALLVASMMEAESRFDAAAVSPRGAVGLMQILPSTARLVGIHDPADPARNVEAGARYLSRLLGQFDQDVVLALAAYNAGPAPVERYGGVPPYRETRAYVDQVLTRYVGHYRDVWQLNRLEPAASS